MRFTIDIENKKILICKPYTKKDLNFIFSILKIEDLDNWEIDSEPMYYTHTITNPEYPIINPNDPLYYDGTSIINTDGLMDHTLTNIDTSTVLNTSSNGYCANTVMSIVNGNTS